MNLKLSVLPIVLLCGVNYLGICQKTDTSQHLFEPKYYFGFGLGLDYGGVGFQMLLKQGSRLGVYGGMGYAIAGLGWQVGLKFSIADRRTASQDVPFFAVMYGYNLAVTGYYERLYYGTSLGIGMDFYSAKRQYHVFSLALLFPFRERNIYTTSFVSPILISLGYKFGQRAAVRKGK